MTTVQNKPILNEWMKLGEEGQRKLFPKPEHLTAADTFAQHADKHRTPTGDFIFKGAHNMAILFSTKAVNAALTHSIQTAQALAKVVSLPVGTKPHQAAMQTLIQLTHHLEKTVKPMQVRQFNTN
jgi:hypothetical protein